jgi:hypothetical protein
MDKISFLLCRAVLFLLSLLVLLGCDKDANGDDSISKSKVVGDYLFVGYSGPLKRELEISFNGDMSGYGQEMSYGSRGNLLSVHEYVFRWHISGQKVILEGVSAVADSDGDSHSSISWSTEFEYQHGMLLPGKGFIGGYAAQAIFEKIDNEKSSYIDCSMRLDMLTGGITVSIVSHLDNLWPDVVFSYGYSYDYNEYEWRFLKGETIELNLPSGLELAYSALASIAQKEVDEGLSLSEIQLRDNYQEFIDKYVKQFEKGKTDYRIGLKVRCFVNGDSYERVLDIDADYYVDNNGNTGVGDLLEGASGYGILEQPFNIAGAINAVKKNGDKTTAAKYYVQGRISSVKYFFTEEYGTAVYNISDTGKKEGVQFTCYNTYFLENTPWLDGNQQISVGDQVIVYGQLTKWYDTYETEDRKAYIYSLNGNMKMSSQFAVDLGIGVMWASRNLGASSPEDFGDPYAWGETQTKSYFSWRNYKFWISGDSANNFKLSKYVTKSQYGTVDNRVTLLREDDAASVNWGGKWQIPTKGDFENLLKYCTWDSTTQNGQFGYTITGKNGNRIFLPIEEKSLTFYWTNCLDQNLPYNAHRVAIGDDNYFSTYCRGREFGAHIRPVIK